MFLLLTRYHDWSDNIIYNYTIIYLDCTSIISHFNPCESRKFHMFFGKFVCLSSSSVSSTSVGYSLPNKPGGDSAH